VSALQADLGALAGPDWRGTVRELPATSAYVELIRASAEHPERFVAHHYTRLLGDLSGGQMIRRTLQRHYGDQVDGALSFYDLDRLGDLSEYKDAYRQRLDDAPWDEAQRAAAVDEANRAFAANAAVFAELGGVHTV
jgi:heme oxygenase